MTQRLAVRLAMILGLLAGSCTNAPPDEGDVSTAVDAVATTTSTSVQEDVQDVLRVDETDGSATTGGGTTVSVEDATTTSASTTLASTTLASTTSASTTLATTTSASTTSASTTSPTTTKASQTTGTGSTTAPGKGYFGTVAVGISLPSGAECASTVRAQSNGAEVRPENTSANNRVVSISVNVDGADGSWNSANASRVTGDFTGTTEDILRWGACKWGFDEDVTRARAVTESSWSINTEGDRTNDSGLCQTMGLGAPCNQSYGLLQVKGSVHDGTYPESKQATAFGVDYAMAWLRACYDGAMGWLGASYGAGDEWGCIGAWFSGLWKDGGANDYIGVVRGHLDGRTWEQY